MSKSPLVSASVSTLPSLRPFKDLIPIFISIESMLDFKVSLVCRRADCLWTLLLACTSLHSSLSVLRSRVPFYRR
jgi:hypothetical protein